MFGIKELSFNLLTGHPFLTALFFILFLLFAVYLYRVTNPPLSRSIRILLISLRIIAVIALFLAIFEPVLSYRREYERKPRLTLLIDKSKSMEINEEGKTRSRRADSLLASTPFEDFSGRFDLRRKYFAGGLIEDLSSADLDKTALGEAMSKLAEEETAAPSEYWLLFSDGISNSGVSPLTAAMKVKTPIYAIGIGTEIGEKDVAISGLDYNQVVFAGKPTEVTVHLEWSGMNNEEIKIEIRSGQKVLQAKSLELAAGNLKQEAKISFTPERPGQQTFRIEIPKLEGESSTDNNSRSFSMTVLKSKLKVLLTAEHLDWEYAFLNRFLATAPDLELTTVVSRKGGGYLGEPFPSRQEELNQYYLLVLYDIDLEALKAKAGLFKSFLADKGGGMLVFLGENYLRNPFPRWLDDYLPFVSRARSAKPLFVKFNGSPAENFLFHPAVRLSEDRQGIREGWSNLPPFEMYIPVDSIVPGTEILVSANIDARRKEMPVLGYRNIGAGKALAMAATPFWHWAFFGYGFGGGGEEYKRFFDGIVNWLSLKEESDPIRITPDKTIYTRGERVGFSASVYDLAFRPIISASGYIALTGENSGDTIVAQFLESGEGRYRAEFDILAPGKYRYLGNIEKEGKKLRESSGQIAVEPFSIEDYQRRPDFDAMTQVAQMTGGRFYRLNEADSLYSRLNNRPIAVTLQQEIVIWNKFWLLTIFILALGLEWLLRKRYQLI